MPRPNSRVEIVTAMRRIRVSVGRMFLPLMCWGGGDTASPSPLTAFSHLSPVLQVIHNSIFHCHSLHEDSVTQAWWLQACDFVPHHHIWSIPSAGCPLWYLGIPCAMAGAAAARAAARPSLCSRCCGGGDGMGGGHGAAGSGWKPQHICSSEDFLMCQSRFKGNCRLLVERYTCALLLA